MNDIREHAVAARRAFLKLSTSADRTAILKDLAAAFRVDSQKVFDANQKDLEAARNVLAPPLFKRLRLDEPKLRDVIQGVEQLAAMADPVGRVLEETQLDEGLLLRKIQTPIGVIAAIFESRPEVVAQIAALAVRSGNAVLLKGGREAMHTNAALGETIRRVLNDHGVPEAVQMLSTRDEVSQLLGMDDVVNLILPRGSNEMVRSIQQNTRIPVLGHADGICHVYIDAAAAPEKAIRIAVDSKAQYPAVCNAAETLLIHRDYPARGALLEALRNAGVELRLESDFGREFMDLIMAVHIVDNVEQAIEHIHRYGSAHTDAIVTEDVAAAQRFLSEVDSAGVYWNASTRFADGFRYGFGAEVGISTNKTHARGPVGIDGLMIYKYHLIGNGHIVATYAGDNPRSFLHRRLR
jgi:glutamate-5-semialdehyde dehydrogenase